MDSMSGMSGMSGMGHAAPKSCSIHMLGNWQTIGACFLTPSWLVKSPVQMVFTCVCVFFLVLLIELIRRWAREWDRYIIAQAARKRQDTAGSSFSIEELSKVKAAFFGTRQGTLESGALARSIPRTFRPTLWQQVVRSLLYTTQFAGAYVVMLIAMSFNGYIILSIVAGGFVGHFFSTRDTLVVAPQVESLQAIAHQAGVSADEEAKVLPQATYCSTSGVCCN